MTFKKLLNFKVGPSKVKMSEVYPESDRYFSIPQLFLMFTDLRNLLVFKQGVDVSVVEDEAEDPEGGSEDNKSHGILSPINMKFKPFDKDAIADDILEDSKGAPFEPKEQDDNIQSPLLDEEIKFVEQEAAPEDFTNTLESFTVEEIIQRLRIRVKNNSLGNLHYFPEKWNGNFN